jgi:hypothetical protein
LATDCGAVCVALTGACSGAIVAPPFSIACCAGSWRLARTGDDGINGDAAEIVSWRASPLRTPCAARDFPRTRRVGQVTPASGTVAKELVEASPSPSD